MLLEARPLNFLKGDELCVWKLDRSLSHVIDLVLKLDEKDVIVKGLTYGVDTSTINGSLLKVLVMRSSYKDLTKSPEQIYSGLEMTRATFYRYAKILDNHTDEEI